MPRRKQKTIEAKPATEREAQMERSRYSRAEVLHQERAVEQLLMNYSQSRVIQQVVQPVPKGLGISKHRAQKLIDRIFTRWREEDKDKRAEMKSAAVRRCMGYIRDCQGRRDAEGNWLEKTNHPALARYEQHLAQLQGTYAPVELDVNMVHAEAMAAVFATYSVEDLEELHNEAERKHQFASRYLLEHPEEREATKVIDVKAEAAE